MKKVKTNHAISFLLVIVVFISFAFFLSLTPASKIQAQTSSPVSGTAEIVNMGYLIYFDANGGNVQYSPSSGFSGDGWSPEYGWVDFNGSSATVPSFQGVNDTETPTDWADGFINLLNGTNGGSTGNISYSVVFNQDGTAHAINHWAWGGNVIGWVDFSGVSITPADSATLDLFANTVPTSITVVTGTNVNLTWTGTGIATPGQCNFGNGGDLVSSPNLPGVIPVSTRHLGALADGFYTYTITCTKVTGGTISDVVTVDVNPNIVPPILTADPLNINPLELLTKPVVLTWDLNDGKNCVASSLSIISNLVWNNADLYSQDSLSVFITGTTLFRIDCSNGSISKTVCVASTETPEGVSCKKPPVIIET